MTSWVAGSAPSAQGWSKVVLGNGHYVTVAGVNFGAYSTNGISYTASTLPTTTGSWNHLTFNGTVHVAFDDIGNCAISSDGGVTWGALVSIGYTGALGGCASRPDGMIIAMGNDSGYCAVSTNNGATWTTNGMATSGHYVGVCWDSVHSVWMTLDGTHNSTKCSTSPDGAAWTDHVLPSAMGYLADVACDGAGNCIIVGGRSPEGSGQTNVAFLTTNGGSSFSTLTLPATVYWVGVNFSNGNWLVVAWHSADAAFSTTTGASWTLDTTIASANWNFVGASSSLFSVTGLTGGSGNQTLIETYATSSGSAGNAFPVGVQANSTVGIPGVNGAPSETFGPATNDSTHTGLIHWAPLGHFSVTGNLEAASGTAYSQTISANTYPDESCDLTIDWAFPGASSNVQTYANIQYGWQYEGFPASTTPNLPALVSSLPNLKFKGTVVTTDSTSSDQWDTAYDCFFGATDTPAYDTQAELMVMVQWNFTELTGFTGLPYGSGGSGAWCYSAPVTIDGQEYYIRNLSNIGWPYIAYFAVNQNDSLAVNIASFIADAISRGFPAPAWFYMVEIGTEVTVGTGTTAITGFNLDAGTGSAATVYPAGVQANSAVGVPTINGESAIVYPIGVFATGSVGMPFAFGKTAAVVSLKKVTVNQNTLLLDQAAWDLVLDSGGNIALAGAPYSIAQDVASAVRTFLGECWYDTTQGLPYWQQILGKYPPLSFVKQKIINAAMSVPNVAEVKVVFTGFVNRNLTGQIQIIDTDGFASGVAFGNP